jgi:hypothetical protein
MDIKIMADKWKKNVNMKEVVKKMAVNRPKI